MRECNYFDNIHSFTFGCCAGRHHDLFSGFQHNLFSNVPFVVNHVRIFAFYAKIAQKKAETNLFDCAVRCSFASETKIIILLWSNDAYIREILNFLIESSTFFLVKGIIFLIGLRLYIVMAAFRGVINFTFLFFVELFLWKNSYICKYEDILIDK